MVGASGRKVAAHGPEHVERDARRDGEEEEDREAAELAGHGRVSSGARLFEPQNDTTGIGQRSG